MMTSKEKAPAVKALRDAEQRAESAERELAAVKRELEKRKPELGNIASARESGPSPKSDEQEDHAQKSDALEELRNEPMMAHLLDALEAGTDIGHYGRLVFAMVAHHFLSEEVLAAWLMKDPDCDAEAAQAMLQQVEVRDYNPPRRERILAWQREQDFPIVPNIEDPDCGNVYRNLKFPDRVYSHIQEYRAEKAEAENG